jgi:hypothetical protein
VWANAARFSQPRGAISRAVAVRGGAFLDGVNEGGKKLSRASSLPGLTRQSILFEKRFMRDGWIRGSPSAKTRFALLPAYDELCKGAYARDNYLQIQISNSGAVIASEAKQSSFLETP